MASRFCLLVDVLFTLMALHLLVTAAFEDITPVASVAVSDDNGVRVGSPEGYSKLVDGNFNTKFFLSQYLGEFWIELRFPTPQNVRRYILTSANDAPERDPKDWILQGFNDDGSSVTLDSRSGEIFSERRQTKAYIFTNKNFFTTYKLTIVGNNGGRELQLAEFRVSQ